MDVENLGVALQVLDDITTTLRTNGLPRSIEFQEKEVHHPSSGVTQGFCCSSSNLSSSSISPLRIEPVYSHEHQLLSTTIRDNNQDRDRHNKSTALQSSDPPARTNQFKYPGQEQRSAAIQMAVHNSATTELLTTSEVPVVSGEDEKIEQAQQPQPTPIEERNQPVEISADDDNIEVEVEEVKEVERGTIADEEAKAKLEAMQIMLEITKLEAEVEAKGKAAADMIERAKQALKEAYEDEETTVAGTMSIETATTHLDVVVEKAGVVTPNFACCVTESIETTIQDAEHQVAFEIEVDERVDDCVVETSALDEEERDGNSVLVGDTDTDGDDDNDGDDNDDDNNIDDADRSVVQPCTDEERPIVEDLIDPPTIIRRSAAPSPSPEATTTYDGKDAISKTVENLKNIMAEYNQSKLDPPTPTRTTTASSIEIVPTPSPGVTTYDGKDAISKKEESVKNMMAEYNQPKPDPPTPTRTTIASSIEIVPTPSPGVTTYDGKDAISKKEESVKNIKANQPKPDPPTPTRTTTASSTEIVDDDAPCTTPKNDKVVAPDSSYTVEDTLENLYTKIEDCRAKLMDPLADMDEQTTAAQLMTKYAKSAQALKELIV